MSRSYRYAADDFYPENPRRGAADCEDCARYAPNGTYVMEEDGSSAYLCRPCAIRTPYYTELSVTVRT